LYYHPEEEAGSAEEQPASNKDDDYTITNSSGIFPAAFLLSAISMAQKTYPGCS
jgi:hypothetical protein